MLIPARRWRQLIFAILLFAVFLFRLWCGTSANLWYADEGQIYLIGLKFYTTHAWPFWGPDAVVPPGGIVSMQVPGALQGLVAGLPFFVSPVPEAPYVLVNLLSFGSLCLLAWYCARRLPEIPAWITWTWLMTAPWSIDVSTRVYNLAYVLVGSVLFFIGFLELVPYTGRGLIRPPLASFLMGLGLCWVMQFHMSWVALALFALAAFYTELREKGPLAASLAWFALGCAVTGVFVLPTYLKFGLRGGMGGTGETVSLYNLSHPVDFIGIGPEVAVRFLSFASFALPAFLREAIRDRMAFFQGRLWLLPLFLFPVIVGLLQPAALALLWFKRQPAHRDWPAIKYVTLALLVLLSLLFVFASVPPTSHTFYVMLPMAMIYSLYCWSSYLSRRGWQIFAGCLLASGILVQTAMALETQRRSWLNDQWDRTKIALAMKDYHIVGERRVGARY